MRTPSTDNVPCAEATEEAVINSLLSADTVTGYCGLREFLPDAPQAE